MAKAVNPIPEGFHTVTPHLVVRGAARALSFYERAFGAAVQFQNPMPGTDLLLHAQIRIGDSVVMLADEFPDWGSLGPDPDRDGAVIVHLCVEDVDAVYNKAVEAGATPQMPVQDMFWGDRYGMVKDPFGHRWSISTRIEDLTPEEMQARAAQALPG